MNGRWKKMGISALAGILLLGCREAKKPVDDLARWVDPFIGTGFHGHVFLGANLPFGAVQLGPVNRSEGWDWCSGYHYSDSTIIGFSHTHLSGTGIGDLGDILLMPFTGDVPLWKGEPNDYATGYLSKFSHEAEIAEPGYYAVTLDRYNIRAELTTSNRVGFHQYQFPSDEPKSLLIDLKEGIGWDQVTGSLLRVVGDSSVEGYRYSTGWAKDQEIYFRAQFSEPIQGIEIFEDSVKKEGREVQGKNIRAKLRFGGNARPLQVKLGISPVSMDNAAANILAEIPHWDFRQTRLQAREAWNTELNRIKVESADSSRLRNFYTALYHTMIAPSVFGDVNGDYRGADAANYNSGQFTNHTIFSLWDTYRAANPLYTLVQPHRVNDFVNSLLAIYQQQGRLPVWHLVGNETNTMPGNSSIQVIADAYLKGFRGYDTSLAWEAVKQTAMQDARGLKWVKEQGFIPADSMIESTAMALEYAIADAAIAKMAWQMGKKEDHQYFSERAQHYHWYFDRQSRFMRGRVSKTEWRSPFSPFEAKHMRDDFCEGNAWQYTWLVPQHVEGLINLLGGDEKFIAKLDSLFTVEGDIGQEASADITGLIGQYAHGNEPSHHIAYLYNYAGAPWKAAEKLRYIVDSMYKDTPDGLCGNEDAGQMSAWYILSAMGLYQVDPAGGMFVIGSPVLNKTTLTLPAGKEFVLRTVDNSGSNIYVQKAELNGKPYNKSYLHYSDIMQGGELVLYMGARPSGTWGIEHGHRPYSSLYVQPPLID